MSRPVNGGARNAPSEPAITSSPKTVLLARWSNRKRRRGREKRSIQRIAFISPRDEARPTAAGPELDLAPALRQPDLVASGDQLKRHEHRDELEYVRGAAGRQRQSGNAEQEDEDQREALFLEDVDQAAERLVAVACQPALDLIADLLRRGACLYRRDLGVGDVRCGHTCGGVDDVAVIELLSPLPRERETTRTMTISHPTAIHHMELKPMRSVRRRGSGRRWYQRRPRPAMASMPSSPCGCCVRDMKFSSFGAESSR